MTLHWAQIALAVCVLVGSSTAATMDAWALAGHGNGRAVFTGDNTEWTLSLAPRLGYICNFTTCVTPPCVRMRDGFFV